MDRDYGMEIDRLQKDMAEIKELFQELVRTNAAAAGRSTGTGAPDMSQIPAPSKDAAAEEEAGGKIEIMTGMHPDPQVSKQMEELCRLTQEKKTTGMINYMGVFASGGRQSNWICHKAEVEPLLSLIENHTAEKVLHCIGNSDRLNILLAILKKPRTVAELVTACGLNSTGQAYHHMKPLLTADLIAEDNVKGVYIVQPHKVQGIIMLLAGIANMVDETYTKGDWDNLDD